MTASESIMNVTAGILVRIEPCSYLTWPRGGGGRCYDAGELLRLPPEWARFLSTPDPINGRRIVRVVDESAADLAASSSDTKK